jgi:hypothetical protein
MDIREGLGDGDIFFKPVMSNSVVYNHPVDDPLYAAHKKITVREGLGNVTRYMADVPMKAVGCIQQVIILPLEASRQNKTKVSHSSRYVTRVPEKTTGAHHFNTDLILSSGRRTFQKPTLYNALSFSN